MGEKTKVHKIYFIFTADLDQYDFLSCNLQLDPGRVIKLNLGLDQYLGYP